MREQVMESNSLVGKMVRPKSGGHNMTVGAIKKVNGIDYAVCVWFDGKRNKTDDFPVAALVESKPVKRSAITFRI